MTERCPLLDENGNVLPRTNDQYGAVWDSGLPDLCIRACFGDGQLKAQLTGKCVTVNNATQEEWAASYGDTGQGLGIRAEDVVMRTGYVQIDNGIDPFTVLATSTFPFECHNK